ncbi:hypothetical protein RI129_012558 [Pyrocoelia pectoralis]|uniref:Protein hunchback n=1 Tax=Pyrocoelia pectoralis TaxID=417401 RepID=A0AAN7UZL3_9COLE
MDTHDSFYDYDISTINCVNISQVKTDFRISDDEDDETLKEPKKFYTLTNFVESIDVKQEINGDNNDNSQPSTDIPIAIVETQPSKEYDDLNHEGEFININISKPANEKHYIIETYSNDIDLHDLEKRPTTPPPPEYANSEPLDVITVMEVDVEVPIKCKDCDFTTFNDDELKSHMKTHVPPSQFSCNVCGHFFKHSYSVKRHMRIHTRVAAYKCTECSFECQRSESLKAHKKIHADDKSVANSSAVTHKCNICSFTTANKSLLKGHLDSHNAKESLKSEESDVSATTQLLLGITTSDSDERASNNFNNVVNDTKLENLFKCSDCNYSTTKLVHLKMHMRKHSADVPFKCKLCDYTTAKKGNFVVHLRNHTGEKPYKCALCGFTCKQFIHLKRHIKNHVNEDELFGCSKCDYKTGEGRELEIHIKTHGGSSEFFLDELQFEDESSDAHSNSSDAYVGGENRKKATKTKMHKCPHCDYTTNQTGNLKRHQKTHFKETEKSTPCSISPIALDVVPKLTTNTPDNILECPECQYKATRKHQMDIHMRVHNGKQLHECNLCDYKSINKYNLSRHQKTHTFDDSNGCQTTKGQIINSEVLT